MPMYFPVYQQGLGVPARSHFIFCSSVHRLRLDFGLRLRTTVLARMLTFFTSYGQCILLCLVYIPVINTAASVVSFV